jgi:hypothetical protein
MIMAIFIRLLIGILFLLAVDIYAYQAVRTLTREALWGRWLYWGISLGFIALIIVVTLNFDRNVGPHNQLFKWMMGLFVLLFVPKLLISFFMLAEDATRLLVGVAGRFSGSQAEQFLPDRRKFVSQLALGLAAIPLAGIIHGIWKGRYNYRVIRRTIFFEDLPSAFEGFTITQISDIHSGSFDDREKIEYGIDLINRQKSDVILFTGDLVNNRADEMEPWVESFGKLRASFGKFSVLGNHDYGDYVQWPSAQAKSENMERLYAIHQKMGFNLLRNDRAVIEKNSQHLNIIGVENWGTGGFPQYGDLDKAAAGLRPDDFKVLMSHDPSHYDHVVKNHPSQVQLTLSGHTHGMQFGIEIPGFLRWSPVKYRYPKWAGLYSELGKYLYVNRGFGFLAFPGRVGIWPEITVLELRKGQA